MHLLKYGMERSSYNLSRQTLEELSAQEMSLKEEDVYFYHGDSDAGNEGV